MYFLYKISVSHVNGFYRFTPDADSLSKGAKSFAIKADQGMMRRILRRCGSADELTCPRSVRGLTYDQIISNIINGSNNSIYVFAHKYPKSHEDLLRLAQ